MVKPHKHLNEQGIWEKCYHQCRQWLTPGFICAWFIANTIAFPVEHMMWDHIWPFYYVGDWLDRTGHFTIWLSVVWCAMFLVSIVMGVRYVVNQRDK